MSLPICNSHSPCARCLLNLPQGVCGFQMDLPNALHAGYRFVFGNVEISNYFLQIQVSISRTTAPILGLFVLSLIHFHAESKYSNENLNSEN